MPKQQPTLPLPPSEMKIPSLPYLLQAQKPALRSAVPILRTGLLVLDLNNTLLSRAS
jgi:hypothetical protein